MISKIDKLKTPVENLGVVGYYDENAQYYSKNTYNTDLSSVYNHFLKHLNQGDLILDIGSGSGRDTKAFMDKGYLVEAIDASTEMARISTQFTGLKTHVKTIEELTDVNKFNGIWACASLLHIPLSNLPGVLNKISHALKNSGYFYSSFKLGHGERISKDGRFYTDLDIKSMEKLISEAQQLNLVEIWVTGGEGKFKGHGQWLNMIASKNM